MVLGAAVGGRISKRKIAPGRMEICGKNFQAGATRMTYRYTAVTRPSHDRHVTVT